MTQFNFSSRPLEGKNVLLTRPRRQTEQLRELFEAAGANVFVQPTIEIFPPDDWTAADSVISSLNDYDFLIFSSSNGVSSFWERFYFTASSQQELLAPCVYPTLPNLKISQNQSLQNPAPQIVAVGRGTAETLRHYNIQDNIQDILIPETNFCAEGVVELLAKNDLTGKRILLIRGDRGRDLLPKELRRFGAIVEQISTYRSVDVTKSSPEIANLLQCGKMNWVTVTSSAIARSLVKMFGDDLHKTKLASVSPITSQTLTECGFPPTVEASEATMSAIVKAASNYKKIV
ncbi:MAG: uroporphyrinogen-III synthase [Planctomycetaceae bacterium]|jgi:uroporphyrinogen III methyltransferase/synthase|nr:uroporphyrinogen-III synthase [Planctomycetaceae bacterium]